MLINEDRSTTVDQTTVHTMLINEDRSTTVDQTTVHTMLINEDRSTTAAVLPVTLEEGAWLLDRTTCQGCIFRVWGSHQNPVRTQHMHTL